MEVLSVGIVSYHLNLSNKYYHIKVHLKNIVEKYIFRIFNYVRKVDLTSKQEKVSFKKLFL